MECVLDIQGFINSEKKYVIKEATVFLISENSVGHWIVTPPIPFNDLNLSAQVFNDSQTKFHHGLEWFDGDVQARKLYSNLRDLTRKMSNIYVFGEEKAFFIENLIARKVVDLEKLGCDSVYTYTFTSEKMSCITHGVLLDKFYMCTMTAAAYYKKWILKNRDKIRSYNSSSSNLDGDTLRQAVHATFNSSDLKILKDDEYFTTSSYHQGTAGSSSGCLPSESYSCEMA